MAILVLTFGGVATGVALEAQHASSPIRPLDIALTGAFLSLPAVGALLVWRRPDNAVGWLLGAAGALGGVYVTCHGWAVYALRTRPGLPGGAVAAWLVTWLLVATVGVLPYLAATFPTGRIETPMLRRFGRVTLAAIVTLAVAQALAPDTLDGVAPSVRPIDNPLGVHGLRGVTSAATGICVAVVIAFTVAAIADAIARYRRSGGDARHQLAGVAIFPALIPATIGLSLLLPEADRDVVVVGGQIVGILGISAAIAIAVLRYRLYDLGDFVRRTAAYVGLSAAVVLAVLALASLVGVLVPSGGSTPAAVAAAAVALALGPLRARLQGGVDRLLFGHRNEPYAVLSGLAAELEASVSPASTLTGMVATVATSLRVPYVAIETGSDDVDQVDARYGRPGGPATRFPLVHQHRAMGALVVAHRSADESFTDAELRLLRDLSTQVAAAVHAATMTAALQRARLELVSSREEERRRLRRDIHDGLGPTLAGTMLQLDSLRELIPCNSTDAHAIAAKIKANIRVMVDDVRRVSHDLRPPALDDLGLLGALREQIHSLTDGSGLSVELDLPAEDSPLGAAAEVAVLRITSEALTNVVRHAHARGCAVRLRVTDEIDLDITDDGVGMSDGATSGVGLVSMRERAAELGGGCTIETIDPAGTRVHVRIPRT